MKISFVIPAHNEERYIGRCLESVVLEAGEYPGEIEILVVDNASTDKTAEVARSFPGVKVVYEPHKGITWARMAGFVKSSGEIIANIDSDTMLTPGWLKQVLREFDNDPDLLAVSGPFIYHDLPRRVMLWVNLFYYLAYATYLVNRFIFGTSSMLQGGNFAVKRKALQEIGGFNTEISFYGEDTDLAKRLHKIGKVKFTFSLPIYTSGRRLAKEGILTSAIKYGVNYFWIIMTGKPYTKDYVDIRHD